MTIDPRMQLVQGGGFERARRALPRLSVLSRVSVFAALASLVMCAVPGASSGEAEAYAQAPAEPRVFWRESFGGPTLDWGDPQSRFTSELPRVYGIGREGGTSFLHARHDATGPSAPKAMHYGFLLERPSARRTAPALEDIAALTWKWRVRAHPAVGADAWEDVAASVYVITKIPSLFSSAKGFKFGWLAHPGAVGEKQHGLLEVELRHDPASPEWRTETVDLCGLYRKVVGPCEGQRVLYVGVVTDADGTKSTAEADYADFALLSK